MAVLNDKYAQIDWGEFREGIKKGKNVDKTETPAEKKKRMEYLEADAQRWKEYYFPEYFDYPTPEFHRTASNKIIHAFLTLLHFYVVLNWIRGLSKTTLTMMNVLYLVLTGRLKFIVYISSTWDAAAAFLEKYRAQLDTNPLLINDYGKQETDGDWSMGDFTTKKGVKFLATSFRTSKTRGQANNSFRPDCVICDDFDTDEECMNPDIINKKWDWFERAVMFSVDVARPYLIIWLGNIIAEDCCVVRAAAKADYREVINIRDEYGKSVWPQKNSEEHIDYLLSKVSWESGQQEYFNNPVRQGQTFKEIQWGKCPPLKELPFVVAYSDPATSNKDKPTARSKVANSMKGTALIGYKNNKFYLYTCVLDNMSNAHFIDGMYFMRSYVNNQTALYNFLENNSLQDPFWEQVLKPLIFKYAKEKGIQPLGVTTDGDKKGEKWSRIESELEPLFRQAQFIFNEEEKGNPHMQRMASQFLTANANSRELGGPDMVQGAVQKTNEKTFVKAAEGVTVIKRKGNAKRW